MLAERKSLWIALACGALGACAAEPAPYPPQTQPGPQQPGLPTQPIMPPGTGQPQTPQLPQQPLPPMPPGQPPTQPAQATTLLFVSGGGNATIQRMKPFADAVLARAQALGQPARVALITRAAQESTQQAVAAYVVGRRPTRVCREAPWQRAKGCEPLTLFAS